MRKVAETRAVFNELQGASGVDLELLRERLNMSPIERLRAHEEQSTMLIKLRNAAAAHKARKAS